MGGMIEDMDKESREKSQESPKMETCKKCATIKRHIAHLIERNREGLETAEKMISRYEAIKQTKKEEYARLQIMLEMCEEEDE